MLYLRHPCSLPILTFPSRVASGLELIAKWLECQMSAQLEVPFVPLSGPCSELTSVPSAPKVQPSMILDVTANLLLSVLFHRHSHTQPHHIHFTSLWTFNSPNHQR